ncbi:HAD-IIIA family hydrolase [Thermodesulfobium sp. 4217-1]|uniref:D-glycero-alpha-D-manno-heptose-1,7-bisphosphate 7-phosphatase n=1 Tax=Thermodesulfobium sp. 4217-1 TaxID=3120013 RepID=UPI003221A0AF
MKILNNPRGIAFLDRDGTINERIIDGYVTDKLAFKFIKNAKKAIRLLNEEKFITVLITNQRGIARGLMTENDLEEIHSFMQAELLKSGAKIDKIFFCPHDILDNCDCRKPKPGMIFQALLELERDEVDINVPKYFIGDTDSDMQTAKNAGIIGLKIDAENGDFVDLLAAVEHLIKS